MVLSSIFGGLGTFLILFGFQPILFLCESPLRWLEQTLFNTRRWIFLALIFVFVFFAYNLGSYFVFHHLPHVTDSIVQVFHGKIFAIGRLVALTPPLRDFFDFSPLMIWHIDKWYSVYPPGHSLLMMVGALIDSAWLINPLLGSLSVILIYFKSTTSEQVV